MGWRVAHLDSSGNSSVHEFASFNVNLFLVFYILMLHYNYIWRL